MKGNMRALVGSCNPTKIAAVQDVFGRCFGQVEAIGIEVASGVSAQPMGMEETFLGAENRVRGLLRLNAEQQWNAQFCVGIEGGVAHLHGRWFAFGVICIADAQGRLGYGVTSHFELPDPVAARLATGAELGEIMDELSGQRHTRLEGGAIGYLSHGQLGRRGLAAQGVFMALLPFLNESLFFPKGD
ncbi:MAG: inosine/xanthosine triphosphatase [Anaerolineae bacterium]